jgi:hypothetical protein
VKSFPDKKPNVFRKGSALFPESIHERRDSTVAKVLPAWIEIDGGKDMNIYPRLSANFRDEKGQTYPMTASKVS